jgi:hypothetical protein
MTVRALFEGLIFDENDQVVNVKYVGAEPCYVVDDLGFLRHISSEKVDRQVLDIISEMMQGNEDLITEQTAKMLGKDDLFTHAIIQNQLKNLSQQFDSLLETGIPEEGRAYMGMMGFKIVINVHGDVINVEQPGMIDEGE